MNELHVSASTSDAMLCAAPRLRKKGDATPMRIRPTPRCMTLHSIPVIIIISSLLGGKGQNLALPACLVGSKAPYSTRKHGQ